MLLLTLDCSSASASAALFEDGILLYEAYVQNGLTHSTSIMPMVNDCFAYGGRSIAQVDAIGAVAGPGSFTGVRLCVATAMGLANGRPCYALNTLDVLAEQAAEFPGLVCPMLDARAGQVYCAAYLNGKPVIEHSALRLTDFLQALEKQNMPCLFVGDGAAVHRQTLEQTPFATIGRPGLLGVHAGTAAKMMLQRQESWQPAALLRPIYLRAPQAERERQRRLEHGGV